MSDNFDITNTEDTQKNEKENKDRENRDSYEKVCFMCHRTESRAGKMIDLPGGFTVCPDCMQKAFDAMNNPDMKDMMNFQNMPNISMINLGDLQNIFPRQQKVKKKEPKEKKP